MELVEKEQHTHTSLHLQLRFACYVSAVVLILHAPRTNEGNGTTFNTYEQRNITTKINTSHLFNCFIISSTLYFEAIFVFKNDSVISEVRILRYLYTDLDAKYPFEKFTS